MYINNINIIIPVRDPDAEPLDGNISELSESSEEEYFEWSCSFDGDRDGSLCDMSQSDGDVFDWTLRSGSTISRDTGPGSAYTGDYYAYIESSYPRKRGDIAV